jgi:predicted phosphodiesterase
MRCALLGDVHGNLHALLAVLEHLAGARCDAVLCTGDLVNYGPFPNECVELVLARADVCVLGNHDQLLARWSGEPAPRRPGRDPALEDAVLRWTGEHLTRGTREALSALPTHAFWPEPDPRLMLSHGSPLSIEEYVTGRTPDARWTAFEQVAAGRVTTVVLGHTHLPMHETRHGLQYVNPGSVGWPKDGDGRASWGILTLPARGEGRFAVQRVPYDRRAFVDAAQAAGLPAGLPQAMAGGRPL